LIALHNGSLESLLEKAKKSEKKNEWLQATEFYQNAFDQTSETKNVLKATELQERLGYCYFRAALKAQHPEQNRKRMNLAIKAHETAVGLVEKIEGMHAKAKLNHNKGWIIFLRSWFESNIFKKKILLDKWWKTETNYFKIYDSLADSQLVGKIYNDLLELSAVDRFHLINDNLEWRKIAEECIRLGEKSIKLLNKENNVYELGRAYCWTSWYYGFSSLYNLIEEKKEKFDARSRDYSKKAITLSEKTKDAWLIGWSNNAASLSYINSNLEISIKYSEKFIKNGKRAKDNYMLSVGPGWKALLLDIQSNNEEDPEKKRNMLEGALELVEETKIASNLSNCYTTLVSNRRFVSNILEKLANFETNLGFKKKLLEQIIKTANEILKYDPEQKIALSMMAYYCLSIGFLRLSETSTHNKKKQELLLKSLDYIEKCIEVKKNIIPDYYYWRVLDLHKKAEIQIALVKLESRKEEKITILEDAVQSLELCLILIEKDLEDSAEKITKVEYGHTYYDFGAILRQLYFLTNKKNFLERALEAYYESSLIYKKAKLPTYLAESYWQIAKVHDQLFDRIEASKYYQLASKAYVRASEKLPNFKDFYDNHSRYMLAWSEIEQAKYSHSRENYHQARIHYENAAKLHEKLDNWKYLSSNYLAWSKVEQAEEISRTEKPQEAINNFQHASKYFKETKSNIKNKITENPSSEERELVTGILKASDLRRKYCQARIIMEEAKLFGREGNHRDSSISYGKAAQIISVIVDEMDVETERKELNYLAILCRAWEKMANAEEATSSELYIEAAELFEKAKEYCFTKKASLWALGNSSFCRGLAAGIEYQSRADLTEHSKAKSLLKSAANSYLQAGFKQASEYAKATQRLFDAFLSMNQAEIEADQEKRAKQYQMAENLLQIAAGSFLKAKQPEKQTQVQGILSNVREEKALAVSLSQVMQAPTVASSTMSFSAPTPTKEVSVGLESFVHANIQANIVAQFKEVKIGQSFCLSIEFVNAGREPALLMLVDDFIPSNFVVVKKPEIYRIEDTTLNMKGKQITPLNLVEVKLTLQPLKKGKYNLNPRVHYLDERGQNKSLKLKTLEIRVEEVIMKDRVTTGTTELDSLMLGGIPEEYAVVLSSPPCDERELIVENFLRVGVKKGISFYISTEANNLNLLDKPCFFLFLCNPKPKTEVPDFTNVFKLQGKTDLNNLGIALTKAYRSIDTNHNQPKRICVEILSEVLEDYGSKTTRKWISDLITNYGAKGFTILAVMDPSMHPSDQANAVINLFDGEISILQSDDPLECKKSILVKKLRNQDYIKNPICLTDSKQH
jgi:KaiC/GvpD/RAD55 family RecA-like ATPase